ncbi:MAG: DUF2779 domain-containing protein [Bacteroidales bacterium]|nr:DUF2779 domain-containing protein [Bacteroidales bacterium]
MEKHLLSKSTFIRGVQCLKSLYLYKNRYFLRDKLSPEQLAKFKRGTDVGVFAQNLFPGGIDCKPKSPSQYRMSVEKTREIIQGTQSEVIYEATFQYDGVLIMLDILAKENGKWNAYEVKSSLKISETYLMDAALQYYVLKNSGIDIDRFFLVHTNPEYVFQNDLEISELFTFVDVTEDAISKQEFVKTQIEKSKKALVLKSSPKIDIGSHCNNPYPCDFLGHCWKHIPKTSIFELKQWSNEEKFELYQKGIVKIEDLKPDESFDPSKETELEARKAGKPFFNSCKFEAFFQQIKMPVVFAGFLGYTKAIPEWKNYKPFDVVPVSLSLQNDPSSGDHNFFNADPSTDPDLQLFEFLKNNIPADATLITFDGGTFTRLLNGLAARMPDGGQSIHALAGRIIDLKIMFDDFIYYHPDLRNDFSAQKIAEICKIEGEGILPFSSDTLAANAYRNESSNNKVTAGTAIPFIKYTDYRAAFSRLLYGFFKMKSENE